MSPREWNAHLYALRSGPLADEGERILYIGAVEHALASPKAANRVGKRPSASSRNVRRAAAQPDQVSRILDDCGPLLGSYRTAVQRHTVATAALNEASAQRAADWRLGCAAVSLGSLVIFLAVSPATSGFLALVGITLFSLVIAVASADSRQHAGDWFVWAERLLERLQASMVMESRTRVLTIRMRNAALPVIAEIVDDLLGDDQDTLYLPTSKQGLYSIRSRDYVVESAASVQLKRKINQVDDATIAICGPRGTGKTTLLEEATKDAAFSVMVQVPATYTPHDFLLHLSAKVCETYIRDRDFPVPEFTSLGFIRRPLRNMGNVICRVIRWLFFAATSAGLLAVALAQEIAEMNEEYGAEIRQEIYNCISRIADYGEGIWLGEKPVEAFALTVAGVYLWTRRASPKFRQNFVHMSRIALRFAALAVVAGSVISLFYDDDIERSAGRLYETAGLDNLFLVIVAFPIAARIIWKRQGAPYVERGGGYADPKDIKAIVWLGLLVIIFCVWLDWVITQEEVEFLVFDDDNAVRVAAACIGMALFGLSHKSGKRRTPHLVARCQTHLYRLRTLQNATAMVSLGIPDKLGASQTTSLSLAPLTYPELVSDFRSILRNIAREYGASLRQDNAGIHQPKVVISIDELDRIGTEEQALAFLREVKAVFGISGVCYLISVAEDVGASFVRRGLPHRDVTESSLDDVLHVRPCMLSESTAILKERVPGLTPPYVYLSHALSGGIPRDLIRYGRRLDEVQQETEAYEISQLAWELITDEIAESLANTRVLLADEPGWTTETAALLIHLSELEKLLAVDDLRLRSRSDAYVLMTEFSRRCVRPMWWTVSVAQAWPTGADLSEQTIELLEEVSAYVYFGLTLLDIFASDEFTRRKNEAEGRSPRSGAIQPLAEARQELSISPQSARLIISKIRIAWGLVAF